MAKQIEIQTPEQARTTVQSTTNKIKFTAIWRDGSKRVFLTESFTCQVRCHNSYYVKLADNYTFACDAIEIEQQ